MRYTLPLPRRNRHVTHVTPVLYQAADVAHVTRMIFARACTGVMQKAVQLRRMGAAALPAPPDLAAATRRMTARPSCLAKSSPVV